MAVSGAGANGCWAEVVDGELTIAAKSTVSVVCDNNVERIIGRLLNGERVHVSSVYDVRGELRKAWRERGGVVKGEYGW